MCRQIDPETGSTAHSYDNAGRLQWYALAASGATGACNLGSVLSNQKILHSYDNLNRLTLVNYPDTSPDVTYGYDDNGNLTSLNSSSANRTYTYNKVNALISELLVTGGLEHSIQPKSAQIAMRSQMLSAMAVIASRISSAVGRPARRKSSYTARLH